MKYFIFILVFLAIAGNQFALADNSAQHSQIVQHMQQKGEQLAKFLQGKLFPPQLIMNNQVELGITEQQRQAILAEIKTTQSDITDIHWQIQKEVQILSQMLDKSEIDEEKTLSHVDRLLSIENKMKKINMGLLIRIKNILTTDQIEKLSELKGW